MQVLNITAHKILDIAEHYTQTRGFNAFSYRDIQNDLGIKTSSIHYYFPSKQDLAVCMMERYLERYQLVLKEIHQSTGDALQKLQQMADIFISASKKDKFCLCGMLAVDAVAMPEALRKHLKFFFQTSEHWIAKILKEGIAAGEIRAINPDHVAAHYLATLEGGLLISRVHKNAKYLSLMVRELLAELGK